MSNSLFVGLECNARSFHPYGNGVRGARIAEVLPDGKFILVKGSQIYVYLAAEVTIKEPAALTRRLDLASDSN